MKRNGVFNSETGAVDLGSVMVGIITIGLISGVIAATVFAVIPWSQNSSAKKSLHNIGLAQSAYKQGMGSYGSLKDLVREKLLDQQFVSGADDTIANSGELCTRIDATGGYLASAKSPTGKFYKITHTSAKPVEVKESVTCFTEDYTPYNMVFLLDTKIPNCNTYEFPATTVNAKFIWGDTKTEQTVTTNNPKHTYTTPGIYTVKVKGQFAEYGRVDAPTQHCITEVRKWKDTKTTKLKYAFKMANNLKVVEEIPSTATDISQMFQQNTGFNGDISHWNTSNVTTMAYMFHGATAFNQDISNWDMSKVNNIAGMFVQAKAFNKPIGKWNTSNVVYMNQTFQETDKFNQPLNNWKTQKVKNMDSMFKKAKMFDQNISGWKLDSNPTSVDFRVESKLRAAYSPFG